MKVLQVNVEYGIGSTGRIMDGLHRSLLSCGHHSAMAFGRGAGSKNRGFIRVGGCLNTTLQVAFTRLFDSHGLGPVFATKEFITRIEKLNPDIIHLHNLHGYYLDIGEFFRYLKRVNKPTVWTLHDCWAFTGHCAHFDFESCERWKSECHSCPLKKEYPKSIGLDRSRQNFQKKKKLFNQVPNMTLVTPSMWLADLSRQSFLSDYPVKVINNGIDLDVFQPVVGDFRKRFRVETQFILLAVASIWGERKGFDYLMALADRLGPEEVLVMVGVTQKQSKKLPANVIGITRTNNIAELAEIYSAADVFVNPTLEDNFPTTNLEALACGTPVITFSSGGSPECIDECCGLVVQRGDLSGLLAAVREVKKRGKAAYTVYCRQRAETLYDKNDRFADYIQLYRDVLKT